MRHGTSPAKSSACAITKFTCSRSPGPYVPRIPPRDGHPRPSLTAYYPCLLTISIPCIARATYLHGIRCNGGSRLHKLGVVSTVVSTPGIIVLYNTTKGEIKAVIDGWAICRAIRDRQRFRARD